MTLSDFWNFIASIFQAIFKGMSSIGYVFNMLLIIIGFIAFISWLSYMSKQKEVTKWD